MEENFSYNEEQLRRDTPLLHSIPHKNPFKVPEGYWEENAERLSIPVQKGNDLKTPEGYFDQLHQEILSKVEVKPTQHIPQKGRLVSIFKWATPVAAAAAVAIFFWFRGLNDQPCESFACLLEKTEITAEDMMLLDSSDLEEVASDLEWNEDTDQEIMDFLLEEELSLEELELIYIETAE